MPIFSPNYYIDGIRAGDRVVLSRAITLVESTLAAHRTVAHAVVKGCLPFSGNSLRVGITGVPGVGKSTFIERFGLHLLAEGQKVAVLAIDPSSRLHRGSILGDKTRMNGASSAKYTPGCVIAVRFYPGVES